MLHLAQRQRRPPPVGHDVGNFTDSPSFVFFFFSIIRSIDQTVNGPARRSFSFCHLGDRFQHVH